MLGGCRERREWCAVGFVEGFPALLQLALTGGPRVEGYLSCWKPFLLKKWMNEYNGNTIEQAVRYRYASNTIEP